MHTIARQKTVWGIDLAHSQLSFSVVHLMISSISGTFEHFYGTVKSSGENNFQQAAIEFEAAVNSLRTGHSGRDAHLKSADFFNCARYPRLHFISTRLTPAGNNAYELKGRLTIKDITRPVQLQARFGGFITDPYGNQKAGFEITGHVRRSQFGLTWNALTRAGTVVVSDVVRLHAAIQLVKTNG